MPEAEAQKWIDMLRPQSWRAYVAKTSHAAYNDIPSWHLHCTKDQAMLHEWQKGLVGAAVEAGAKLQTVTIDAAHSPWVSRLEQASDFVRKVAGG